MMNLSILFAVLVLPISTFARDFTDVPASHASFHAIQYAASEGIVSGYPDGSFKPDGTVNRAEITKIIIASMFDEAEIQSCDTAHMTFSDIPKASWYAPYVCVALQNHIVSGYADGTFRGEQTVNVAEAAKIVSLGFFDDLGSDEGDEWYSPYIQALSDERALPTSLSGLDAGLKRGQLAEIIFRLDAGIDTQPSLDFAEFEDDSSYAGADEEMDPEDCLPDEQYDEREHMCYVEIECETEADCNSKLAEIDEAAERTDEVGSDYEEFNTEEGLVKASYTVSGNTITPVGNIAAGDDARYRKIWQLFITLIPESARKTLDHFEISTDGKEESLAAVYPDETNPTMWTLVVDDADAFNADGTLSTRELSYSLIHETAHLLSLGAKDVPPIKNLQEDDTEAFKQARTSCAPRYFTGEGCSNPESTINAFFQSFWKTIYAKFADAFDGLTDESEVPDLYAKNPSDYVSEYAASNPGEDFAESFTEFVLNDRQKNPSTVAERKKEFFYAYADFVDLRTVIRQRLTLAANPS